MIVYWLQFNESEKLYNYIGLTNRLAGFAEAFEAR